MAIKQSKIPNYSKVLINLSDLKSLRLLIEEGLLKAKAHRYYDKFKADHKIYWKDKDIIIYMMFLCTEAEKWISMFPQGYDKETTTEIRRLITEIMLAIRKGTK